MMDVYFETLTNISFHYDITHRNVGRWHQFQFAILHQSQFDLANFESHFENLVLRNNLTL